MKVQHIDDHVKILGWLYILSHAFLVVLGIFLFMLLTGIAVATDDQTVLGILPNIGVALLVFCAILSLPGMLAGYGLLKTRPWARVLTLVVGFFNLLNFPLGTVLAVYTVIVLLSDDSAEYFTAANLKPA